jgi:hypothetical protein
MQFIFVQLIFTIPVMNVLYSVVLLNMIIMLLIMFINCMFPIVLFNHLLLIMQIINIYFSTEPLCEIFSLLFHVVEPVHIFLFQVLLIVFKHLIHLSF